MTYSLELDDLRREIRKDTADAITFWPKVSGQNVVADASASYSVYDPAGALIQGPTAVTPTGTDYSLLTLSISAISTLAEDYSVRITWTPDAASVARVDVIFFDVVLYPYGEPSVSLNDLLEERPDVGEILGRMGLLLGFDDATATEEMAGVFAIRARVELDALVRDQVAQDARSDSAWSYSSVLSTGAGSSSRFARPNLILNRERLNRVERKLALKLIYAADMTEPEGDEEAAGLYRHYKAEAELAWKGIGPLKYDTTEDLIPDAVLTDIGRVVSLRRAQA